MIEIGSPAVSPRCPPIPPLHSVRHAPTWQLCYPAAPLLRSHARFHVIALSPSSPLSRASAQCPTPLSRPLPSPAATSSIALLRASRSPYRGNPQAHRPAMRDVPTHAPPLRSPCPFSFILTPGNAFEWRKIRRIYHAWSQAVDACIG
jgi:hypothetical protein